MKRVIGRNVLFGMKLWKDYELNIELFKGFENTVVCLFSFRVELKKIYF